MKKFSLILMFSVISLSLFSQNTEKKLAQIPSVDLKTVEGKTFNSSQIENNGKPIIISFWATWCKPCCKELNTISEVYADWQKETGVKLIAVSIDDSRSSDKVKPLVDGNNWDYEILLDPNQDFKRAMNVNMVPHMFILNGNKEIVWQHTSFTEGGELEVIDIVRKIIKGEEIK
jgi:cytochrome c biogenesis protein CcmG, thiol:disulfide interchange protein DsbE